MKPVLIARVQRFLIGTALLSVLLAGFAYWVSTEHVRAVQQTLQTAAFLEHVDQLLLTVDDAETGQRGYLLTGKREYLAPFLQAEQEVSRRMAEVERTGDSSGISIADLTRLRKLIEDKMAELQKTIRFQDSGQHAAALAEVETGRGHSLMTEIREMVASIQRQESNRFLSLQNEQRQRQQFLTTVLICVMVVTLIFLILANNLSGRFARERARVEQQILNTNAALEERVHARTAELEERTIELQKRTRELEQSNADLTQFAYVASHDLQEPLRMVRSYMGLLERHYGGALDAKATTYMRFAAEGAARMQALISDLLQYSRTGTQPILREKVPMQEVVNAAIKNLELAITETAAEVHCGDLPVLDIDATKMTQVFQNLISNAIKFRKPESHPKVDVRAERIGNTWQFSVTDNGVGFDTVYQERIFEMFQRLHGTSEYAGNGIGLSICRRIIEQHGGRIWAESEIGVGSVFYFVLPATASKEHTTEKKPAATFA
jgi:signal transduction histidine kinase